MEIVVVGSGRIFFFFNQRKLLVLRKWQRSVYQGILLTAIIRNASRDGKWNEQLSSWCSEVERWEMLWEQTLLTWWEISTLLNPWDNITTSVQISLAYMTILNEGYTITEECWVIRGYWNAFLGGYRKTYRLKLWRKISLFSKSSRAFLPNS